MAKSQDDDQSDVSNIEPEVKKAKKKPKKHAKTKNNAKKKGKTNSKKTRKGQADSKKKTKKKLAKKGTSRKKPQESKTSIAQGDHGSDDDGPKNKQKIQKKTTKKISQGKMSVNIISNDLNDKQDKKSMAPKIDKPPHNIGKPVNAQPLNINNTQVLNNQTLENMRIMDDHLKSKVKEEVAKKELEQAKIRKAFARRNAAICFILFFVVFSAAIYYGYDYGKKKKYFSELAFPFSLNAMCGIVLLFSGIYYLLRTHADLSYIMKFMWMTISGCGCVGIALYIYYGGFAIKKIKRDVGMNNMNGFMLFMFLFVIFILLGLTITFGYVFREYKGVPASTIYANIFGSGNEYERLEDIEMENWNSHEYTESSAGKYSWEERLYR